MKKILITLIISLAFGVFAKGSLVIDDKDNKIYTKPVSTGFQICFFDNKNVTAKKFPDNEQGNVIYNLYYKNNLLYVASLNGAYKYDGLNWKNISKKPAYCMGFQNGNIWIGSNKRLLKNGKNFVTLGISYSEIRAMIVEKGFRRFGTTSGFLETSKPLYNVRSRNMAAYRNKKVTDIELIGSDMYFIVEGKLKRLSSKGWKDLKTKASIVYNYNNIVVIGKYYRVKIGKDLLDVKGNVTGLATDKLGNLWIHTSLGNMYKWNGTKLEKITI